MFQITSAETFTTHLCTKFHIPGCSVSLVFAMTQKYENRFLRQPCHLTFSLKLALVKDEYY